MTTSSLAPQNIPDDQWNLPVTLSSDGEMMSLEDFKKNPEVRFTLESASKNDIKKLVLARIELQPTYPTRYMLGFGEVDKKAALKEVGENSIAGEFIIESEMKVVEILKEEVLKQY